MCWNISYTFLLLPARAGIMLPALSKMVVSIDEVVSEELGVPRCHYTTPILSHGVGT